MSFELTLWRCIGRRIAVLCGTIMDVAVVGHTAVDRVPIGYVIGRGPIVSERPSRGFLRSGHRDGATPALASVWRPVYGLSRMISSFVPRGAVRANQ